MADVFDWIAIGMLTTVGILGAIGMAKMVIDTSRWSSAKGSIFSNIERD